uniref:Aldehyde oxidase GLOX n=1 Tax=Araucaria cunninghamii TaxID=56994 RepID=A0A0D6R2B0_ARACU
MYTCRMAAETAAVIIQSFVLLNLLFKVAESQLPGKWETLMENAGIASMHTAVTHYGTVVFLDRTDIGESRISLPKGSCRDNPTDQTLKHDCTAHSVVFNPATNEVRPLKIITDTWCSSGQFLPDGTLLQTGGDLDGNKKIRKFVPCPPEEFCDWTELDDVELKEGRWYATNQILPDGRVIIVGGRGGHSLEYYPPSPTDPVDMPFLIHTGDEQMDNLYPYVHLLPNDHLFIFANTESILYDYKTNQVVKNYPPLEGGPRNYPSAGSSVMLALTPEDDYAKGEIVVCGGARFGAFLQRIPLSANGSCGRMVATDPEPSWVVEDMPFVRIMGDMVMLPTGDVMIINGAQAGSQGFELASQPCLNPVLYQPSAAPGLQFMTLTPTTVPRMYHSTAVLLPDGRILIAGSNPHYYYVFDEPFPTELRVEAFSPEYLEPGMANLRPHIIKSPEVVAYGSTFNMEVSVELPVVGIIEVNMGSAPFATHSFSQGQRLVKLKVSSAIPSGAGVSTYTITATAPPNAIVAPPSYYMVFAVNQGVPSVAKWVQLVNPQ